MTYTTIEQLPLVLSVEQLAQVLGIGKNYAYELVRCGEIESIRVGHRFRIPKEFFLLPEQVLCHLRPKVFYTCPLSVMPNLFRHLLVYYLIICFCSD